MTQYYPLRKSEAVKTVCQAERQIQKNPNPGLKYIAARMPWLLPPFSQAVQQFWAPFPPLRFLTIAQVGRARPDANLMHQMLLLRRGDRGAGAAQLTKKFSLDRFPPDSPL